MNQNLLHPNRIAAAPLPPISYCFKCRWEGHTRLTVCPRCGRRLFSQTNIRWRGAALLILGLSISGLISAVTFFVAVFLAAAAKDPRNHAQFKGGEVMLLFIFIIFGALIASGLTAAVSGIWQLVFGRRNLVLMWICGGFLLIALVVGTVFRALAR